MRSAVKGSAKLSRFRWEDRVFWGLMALGGVALAAGVLVYGRAAAAQLGFSNRVLHDVPSPDGRFRAICQEVPAFDGPEYQTRLHLADGTLVRNLAYGGDGHPCHEVAWSPDGRLLTILARQNSALWIVDLDDPKRNRLQTLTDQGDIASNVRFVGPRRVAYLSCSRHLARRMPDWACGVGGKDRRLGL